MPYHVDSVIQLRPLALRVTFDLLEVLVIMRVVLKFVIMKFGELSVMTRGVKMMVE